MRRALVAAVAMTAACSSGAGGACHPDGGCFCSYPADIAICDGLDAGLEPFCCTDNGGKAISCGQPVGCVLKPGVAEAMATGANYCCPAP